MVPIINFFHTWLKASIRLVFFWIFKENVGSNPYVFELLSDVLINFISITCVYLFVINFDFNKDFYQGTLSKIFSGK